ncbi:hypothetical protein Tco_0697394, partial [Tanacetum coccineum]
LTYNRAGTTFDDFLFQVCYEYSLWHRDDYKDTDYKDRNHGEVGKGQIATSLEQEAGICIKMATIGLKAAASISSELVSSFLGKESTATLRHSSSKCRKSVPSIFK